jgi:hypothetical protein
MREKDIPTTEEFLLETPLYSSYRIGPWNYKKVLEIEFFPGTLDTHCAECGKASVFVVRKAQLPFVGDLPHMRQAQSLEELLNDPHPHFPTEGDRLQTQPIDEYAAKDRVFILQFECTRSP